MHRGTSNRDRKSAVNFLSPKGLFCSTSKWQLLFTLCFPSFPTRTPSYPASRFKHLRPASEHNGYCLQSSDKDNCHCCISANVIVSVFPTLGRSTYAAMLAISLALVAEVIVAMNSASTEIEKRTTSSRASLVATRNVMRIGQQADKPQDDDKGSCCCTKPRRRWVAKAWAIFEQLCWQGVLLLSL